VRHPLMHNPATAACTLGHHARLGMGLRTRSMLGPSSVARLRRSHAEFRQNRRETDATKLQKMLSEASTGLQTMRTQVGWKDSSEIGNTSGVLSGIKPAAGD